MDAIPKTIQFYELDDGSTPARDWLDALELCDSVTYDRIISFIDRVEDGNTSNFKPEGEGVTALIMDFGPGYRLYFGQHGNDLIVLLIGGDKRTQTRDLATAKEYWRKFNA